MSRIFVLEEPRRHLDMSTATAHGAITYLFKPEQRRASVFASQAYLTHIVQALAAAKYDPEKDSFLVGGSMVNVALAMIALASFTPDKLRLLVFNSSLSAYEMREVSLAELEDACPAN